MRSQVGSWWRAASLLALAVAALDCKTPPPSCPESDVCVLLDQTGPLQQTPETYLKCPVYVGWNREGTALGLAPGLPLRGEAKLDTTATRKRRVRSADDESAPELCCYHWYAKCAAPKPGG